MIFLQTDFFLTYVFFVGLLALVLLYLVASTALAKVKKSDIIDLGKKK